MRLQLVGQRFGRLVVEAYAGSTHSGSRWRCLCDCGNYTETYGFALRDGTTQSCGCLSLQRLAEGRTTHGASHTAEYAVWEGMIQRCTNKNSANYKNYGAKGVRVSQRWRKFENFLADMGKRPSPKHMLERKNGKAGYNKFNCVWATRDVQNNNTSRNRYLTHNGQRQTVAEWAKSVGLNYNTLTKRLLLGWPLKKAIENAPRHR